MEGASGFNVTNPTSVDFIGIESTTVFEMDIYIYSEIKKPSKPDFHANAWCTRRNLMVSQHMFHVCVIF